MKSITIRQIQVCVSCVITPSQYNGEGYLSRRWWSVVEERIGWYFFENFELCLSIWMITLSLSLLLESKSQEALDGDKIAMQREESKTNTHTHMDTWMMQFFRVFSPWSLSEQQNGWSDFVGLFSKRICRKWDRYPSRLTFFDHTDQVSTV